MIPNKSNFKLQELTPITGVKPYVIRYWETEFSEISPITSDGGHKIYGRKDVEAILRVKRYLFEEKLTIPEAKLKMSSESFGSNSLASVDFEVITSHLQKALSLIETIKAKRNW